MQGPPLPYLHTAIRQSLKDFRTIRVYPVCWFSGQVIKRPGEVSLGVIKGNAYLYDLQGTTRALLGVLPAAFPGLTLRQTVRAVVLADIDQARASLSGVGY